MEERKINYLPHENQHHNHQHQTRNHLLFPSPGLKTTPGPPVIYSARIRPSATTRKGPRHIKHRVQPTAFEGILNPPHRIAIFIVIEIAPALV
jgi:hypothetical protein